MLISYGANSSTQLFMQYGFCPPPGTNAAEAAHLAPFAPGGSVTGRPLHRLPASPALRANAALAALPPGSLPLGALFVDLLVAYTDDGVLAAQGGEAAVQVGR